MDLVIKELDSQLPDTLPAEGSETFAVSIRVSIGEREKPGAEVFHFFVASPMGSHALLGEKGFNLIRGLILMERFNLTTLHRAVDNLMNHTRSLENWDDVIKFFVRYARYDSEDLNGELYP